MAWVCKFCATNNDDECDMCFVCDMHKEYEQHSTPVVNREKDKAKMRSIEWLETPDREIKKAILELLCQGNFSL